MPDWIHCWVIISRNRNDDISSTKVIGLSMTKINIYNIIFQINLDVSANKNFLDVNLLGLRNSTRLAEKTIKGDTKICPPDCSHQDGSIFS